MNKEKNNFEIINNKGQNPTNNIKSEEDINKYNKLINNLLKLKGFNNIDQLISWIKNIKQYKDFIDDLQKVFLIYNENNYKYNNYSNIISWIEEIINKPNRNIYEQYFQEIMKKNDLKDISEFKNFMNKNLNINKKNTYI